MTPRRVLFIRLSAIGDILLTTPVLRQFHERFPDAEIDFLVKEKYISLIDHHPLINSVLSFPDSPSIGNLFSVASRLRKQKYDLIFDLQKHWRSYLISWLSGGEKIYRYKKYSFRRALLVYFKMNRYKNIPQTIPQRYFLALQKLDIFWKKCNLELVIPDSVRRTVERKAALPEEKFIIGVAPGAGRRTKQWPLDYFIQFMKKLQADFDLHFLLLGGEDDMALSAEIENQIENGISNWCGKTSLQETAALLDRCQLLLCNDSGLMHLAVALEKRIVAFFGPTVREFGFFPFSDQADVLENEDLHCRPCSYHGTDSCPEGHLRCMNEISPEQAYQTVCRYLSEKLKRETP